MESWEETAARQGGAIARWQLLDHGLSSSAIGRRLRSGSLLICHPGVYAVAGSPPTLLRRRWAGLLAAGKRSVLSFESAGRVHRLAATAERGFVECTVPHSGSQRLDGVIVHQIDDLAPIDVLAVDGMPVTSVRRTIVDLAAVWRMGRLALSLDDAVAAGKTSYVDVGACLRTVARRGKPGVRVLTTLLDERGPGAIPPASVLERDFFALAERGGLPRPSRQHPLPRADGTLGLVDAAWTELKVIVEVDGRRWHQRLADMKRDRDRDLQAAGRGWLVIRLLHEHVVHAPEETIRELWAALEARRRQFAS